MKETLNAMDRHLILIVGGKINVLSSKFQQLLYLLDILLHPLLYNLCTL